MVALVAILIARKKRMLVSPIPNYPESDRLKDCVATDAIRISNIRHRLIYGRVEGFKPPPTLARGWSFDQGSFPVSESKDFEILNRAKRLPG